MSKVILKGYIEIPESELVQVLGALPEHKELTLREQGCLVFRIDRDNKYPTRYNVYEEFVNREAFEQHQKRVRDSNWGKIAANVKRNYQIYDIEN